MLTDWVTDKSAGIYRKLQVKCSETTAVLLQLLDLPALPSSHQITAKMWSRVYRNGLPGNVKPELQKRIRLTRKGHWNRSAGDTTDSIGPFFLRPPWQIRTQVLVSQMPSTIYILQRQSVNKVALRISKDRQTFQLSPVNFYFSGHGAECTSLSD